MLFSLLRGAPPKPPAESALVGIHNAFVPILLVVGGVTLICGLALLVLGRTDASPTPPARLAQLTRAFRILLSATAIVGLLQAFWGGLLFLRGCRPGENLHFVYGAIVLLAIPVAYAYSDQKQVRRDLIIMTIAVVAILGAVLRAVATGPGSPVLCR